MNKYLEIIILHVCYLLLRAYSLYRLVLNYDVMSTDIEELTWQHKDMNVHHWFWLYCHMNRNLHLDNSFCRAQLHLVILLTPLVKSSLIEEKNLYTQTVPRRQKNAARPLQK